MPVTPIRCNRGFTVVLILMLLGCLTTQAQRNWNWYIVPSLGVTYYLGELSESSFPDLNTVHAAGGLALKYQYRETFSISLGFTHGKLSGADSLSDLNAQRGLQFRSSLNDIHVLLGWTPIRIKRKLRPRGKSRLLASAGFLAGFGYARTNPIGQRSNGEWVALQPLGTEGQFSLDPNAPSPYSLWASNFKLGTIITFYVGPLVNLDIYAHYSFASTDYIDDVSGTYPDRGALLLSPNGLLTSEFTYRRSNGFIDEGGSIRGNPDTNDGFANIGLSLSVRLTDHSRWAPGRRGYRRKARF